MSLPTESTLAVAVPQMPFSDSEELAAELTEAAFGVALKHGIGADWLDKKLQLWNAMTRTVKMWDQYAG